MKLFIGKKSFTLIELLVVIIIIVLIILFLMGFGWNFIKQLQFRNDKEDFINHFNKLRSLSLSSNYYKSNTFDAFIFNYDYNQSLFDISILSGTDSINLYSQKVKNSFFESHLEGFEINIYPFELGCLYKNNVSELNTGKVDFKMKSKYDKKYYCFQLDLDSCKLNEIKCL